MGVFAMLCISLYLQLAATRGEKKKTKYVKPHAFRRPRVLCFLHRGAVSLPPILMQMSCSLNEKGLLAYFHANCDNVNSTMVY